MYLHVFCCVLLAPGSWVQSGAGGRLGASPTMGHAEPFAEMGLFPLRDTGVCLGVCCLCW